MSHMGEVFDRLYAERVRATRIFVQLAYVSVVASALVGVASLWQLNANAVVWFGVAFAGYFFARYWTTCPESEWRDRLSRDFGRPNREVGVDDYQWVENAIRKWPDLRAGVQGLLVGGALSERGLASVWREVRKREARERESQVAAEKTRVRSRIVNR